MINDQITARLYVFIRENVKGGCKKFSLGDKCECPLCDLDRLLEASNKGASMSQHTELIAKLIALSEMLDEYEAGGFKWSEEAATARDAADALQALERVPMTEEVAKMARTMHTWPDKIEEVIRATEAHHGITPPESKG